MCFGMGYRYEIKSGPEIGECRLGKHKPADAKCMREEMESRWENEHGETPTEEQLDKYIDEEMEE